MDSHLSEWYILTRKFVVLLDPQIDNCSNKMKTFIQKFYDRSEGALQISGLFIFPISLLIATTFVTNSIENAKIESTRTIEQSKIRRDYVSIATGILSQPVKEGDETQKPIRSWAVEVLDMYSPVRKMTTLQKDALVKGDSRTTYFWGGDKTYDSWDTDNTYDSWGETGNAPSTEAHHVPAKNE